MWLRLGHHSYLILLILFVALLLGPPLSFAKNLPTACNIFNKSKAEKSGHCGHRPMFSKMQDKSPEAEAVLFSNSDLGSSRLLIIQSDSLLILFSSGSNPQSNPLRCWSSSSFGGVSPYSFRPFQKNFPRNWSIFGQREMLRPAHLVFKRWENEIVKDHRIWVFGWFLFLTGALHELFRSPGALCWTGSPATA